MFTIVNHVLYRDGQLVAQKPSPNRGASIKPTVLTIHYTAASSASGAISWLCNSAAKASAHLVIDQAGAVTQLVPFDRAAWHAGASAWRGRKNVNGFSIGIELANAGLLGKNGAGQYFEQIGKKVVPADLVVLAAHKNDPKVIRAWAAYPDAQLDALVAVAQTIVVTYGIAAGDIVGHDDICIPKNRKTDPGPAFPFESFRSRVTGRMDATLRATPKASKPAAPAKAKASAKSPVKSKSVPAKKR